jgi:hypothetical protein
MTTDSDNIDQAAGATAPPGYGWEGDRLVPLTPPVFPGDDMPSGSPEPAEDGVAQGLRIAILTLLAGAERGAYTRLAALGVVTGVFSTVTDGARAVHCHETTLARAVERLREELRHAGENQAGNRCSNGGYE